MNLWYRFNRASARAALQLFGGVTVRGREHLPKAGGMLIVANHQSFLDPPLVAVAMPHEIHFLARKTLFRNPLFSWLITSLNSIPVDQERPDMNGPRLIIKHLKRGDSVLLFPEGSRTLDGEPQPAMAGAGLIACKAGVPVVPVWIEGTYHVLPRGRKTIKRHPMSVTIGPAFEAPAAAPHDKDAYRRVAQSLMQHVTALRPAPSR